MSVLPELTATGRQSWYTPLPAWGKPPEDRILINGRGCDEKEHTRTAIQAGSAIYRRTVTSMAWCWIIIWPITWCCSSILNLGSSAGRVP